MSAAAAWLVYCTAVAVLLGLAAVAAEAGAREVDRPGRWIWFSAMVAAVLLPAAAFFGPSAIGSGLPVTPGGTVLSLPAITAAAPEGGWLWFGSRALLVLWVLNSTIIAAYIGFSWRRLHMARSGWERVDGRGASFAAEEHGEPRRATDFVQLMLDAARPKPSEVPVLVTADLGPGVYGLRAPVIVVPRWVLALDGRVQRLLLLHEREHVRAGDPRLVLAALGLVVLMPWNPALWWMLRRLRLAIEIDCDARVLRHRPDPRAYGNVLLEVGRHRGPAALLVAFAEPRTFLERRIRRMTATRSAHPIRRAMVLGTLAGIALVVAVCARDPMSPSNPMEARALVQQDISAAPAFTPYTTGPKLRNPAQVAAALEKTYPPLLRDAGIEGTAAIWMFVDGIGAVRNVRLARTSGYDALDEAALKLADVMQFTPAENRGRVVNVWVQVPVRFAARPPGEVEPALDGVRTTARAERRLGVVSRSDETTVSPVTRAAGAGTEGTAQQPSFTPFTTEPRLRNTDDVAKLLEANYPPLLRDAGIGGTAIVWFFIDDEGNVRSTRIQTSAGHQALDEAALRVAAAMSFTPAENRGRRVPVWVQIPIKFTAR
jgi:TonB family protein